MDTKKDYVIEVYGRGYPTWLAAHSDEDDSGPLATTTDLEMAIRYTDHSEARRAVKAAAKAHPGTSFRLGVLPAIAA